MNKYDLNTILNNYHVKNSGLNNYFRLIKYITLISFFYLFDHVNIFVVYVLLFWLFFGSYADFCTSQISVTIRFSSFRCSVFFMVQFVRIWKMIFRVILCDTLYTLFDTLSNPRVTRGSTRGSPHMGDPYGLVIIRDVILLAETQFDPAWNRTQWNSSFCGHMIFIIKSCSKWVW